MLSTVTLIWCGWNSIPFWASVPRQVKETRWLSLKGWDRAFWSNNSICCWTSTNECDASRVNVLRIATVYSPSCFRSKISKHVFLAYHIRKLKERKYAQYQSKESVLLSFQINLLTRRASVISSNMCPKIRIRRLRSGSGVLESRTMKANFPLMMAQNFCDWAQILSAA